MNRTKTAASVLALSLAFAFGQNALADDVKPNRAHIVELSRGDTAQHMIEIEKNGPVFVFIKADWCGWCHMMEPILKAAFAERYPDGTATLVIADVDEHPELRNNKGVPQLIPYRGLVQKGEAMMGVPDELFPAGLRNPRPSDVDVEKFKTMLNDFFNQTNVRPALHLRRQPK